MCPGCFAVKVFQAYPASWKCQIRPRMCSTDYLGREGGCDSGQGLLGYHAEPYVHSKLISGKKQPHYASLTTAFLQMGANAVGFSRKLGLFSKRFEHGSNLVEVVRHPELCCIGQ